MVREEWNTWWELDFGGGGHCRRNSSNKVGGESWRVGRVAVRLNFARARTSWLKLNLVGCG